MEKRERSENWNSQLTFTSSMKLFDILNRYWHMALIFFKKKNSYIINTEGKRHGIEFNIHSWSHLYVYEIITKICRPVFCSTAIQFFSEECLEVFRT